MAGYPVTTRRLKRIGPLKFGLIMGIMYALLSLIIIPFMLLSVGLSLLAPNHNGNVAQGIGAVFGLIVCLFLPVIYGVIGGLMGMLMAWVYNVVAGWIGGIEFEVE